MTIDHVGVVVASIEASTSYYIRHFGLRRIGGPIVDPLQDVELQFLEDGRGQRILARILAGPSLSSTRLRTPKK